MKIHRILATAAAGMFLAGMFAGCKKSSSPYSGGNNGGNNGGNPYAVTIQGFAFNSSSITVPMGTTITWTNKDAVTHTVTSDNGTFDSGNVPPGTTFAYTFNTAGTFTYHCKYHTYMKGTVIVQ